MTSYRYKGWTIEWEEGKRSVNLVHSENCVHTIYTGETLIDPGWSHCPQCRAPLTSAIMRHLMQAYKFLKAN